MILIDSNIQFEEYIDADQILTKLEKAGRTCYKSEDNISEGSAERLIRSCIKRGHESVLEHAVITYRVICDRGVSHEWVRHRIAAYSQESTRYCNYGKDKFNNQLTFIKPYWFDSISGLQRESFIKSCEYAEVAYLDLLKQGFRPEMARAVLPNCLKTEFVCTMNIRELRHFLKLRTAQAAHPDIRKLAWQLLTMLKTVGLGVLVEDIEYES